MNLCFTTNCGKGYVDFPFQTPTELTKAVLKITNKEERLKIIEEQLIKWKWNKKEIRSMMNEISKMLDDSSLILGSI